MLSVPRLFIRCIRFLFRHWMAVLAVAALSVLLYSPTKKMVSSFDLQHAVHSLLQSLRIIPTVKYCDSVGEIPVGSECRECPAFSECHDGIAFCKGDRVLIRGECLYDETEIELLKTQMESYTLSLLSAIRAERECRSYWLYAVFDEAIEGQFDGMYLPEEALEKQLAEALQLDIRSHLFTQVFGSFTASIKSQRVGTDLSIKRKDLDFAVDRGYYSHRAAKSVRCHLSILLTDHAAVIVPVSVIGSLVVMLWSVRRQRMLRKQRARQRVKDGKRDVLRMLREHMANSNRRWIPIMSIRAQLNGGDADDKTKEREWKKIVRDVDRDANVTRSCQMVDGLQKDCWKLSDIALNDW